jgi:hypothetical protein
MGLEHVSTIAPATAAAGAGSRSATDSLPLSWDPAPEVPSAPLGAPEGPDGTRRRLPPELNVRITEVVRGSELGPEIWIVCRDKPLDGKWKWDVQPPTTDKAKAEVLLEQQNREDARKNFILLGPFTTPKSKLSVQILDELTISYRGTSRKVNLREALAKYHIGQPDQPLFADLVVWTEPSFRKFIYPYYARIFGSAVADDALDAFLADDVLFMVHLPTTDYVNPNVDPGLPPLVPALKLRAVMDDTPGEFITWPHGGDAEKIRLVLEPLIS